MNAELRAFFEEYSKPYDERSVPRIAEFVHCPLTTVRDGVATTYDALPIAHVSVFRRFAEELSHLTLTLESASRQIALRMNPSLFPPINVRMTP